MQLGVDQVHLLHISVGGFAVRVEHVHDAGEQMLRAGKERQSAFIDLDLRRLVRDNHQAIASPTSFDQLALIGQFLGDVLD